MPFPHPDPHAASPLVSHSPEAGTSTLQPRSAIPSRSASLIVSSRSGRDLSRAARQPITFALPSASDLHKDPSHFTPNISPLRASTSLFKKLGRSLSQSRTQLVRRVSGGKANAQPTSATPSAPTVQIPTLDECKVPPEQSAPGGGLKRGFRTLGRSRSEGRRRAGVAREEQRMDELVRRTEMNCRGRGSGTLSEGHSGLGSYFWSDSLGVCWDGREQVHPDLLSVQQNYSSNADFVPEARVVYASTLSTFPPRPPLRRLSSQPPSPALSPASQIILDYRAAHGTVTPAPPPQLETISSESTPIPTPVPDLLLPTNEQERPERGGRRLGYARSVASDTSSGSAPSETGFGMGQGRASEDSSTSLESMRDTSPTGRLGKDHRPKLAETPSSPRPLPRFALVDDGPVKPSEGDGEAMGSN